MAGKNPSTIEFRDTALTQNLPVTPATPLPVGGGVASGSADSTTPVKVGAKYNVTLPTFADGNVGDLQIGSRGALGVTLYPANNANAVGTIASNSDAVSSGSFSSLVTSTFQYVSNGGTWDRLAKASATSRIVSAAASTNGTSAKASAGTVYSIDAVNTTAALKYLKLYNKASAPTVGTDTPVLTIPLSPSNAGTTRSFPTGMYFSTGIAYALTGAAADADATVLVAGDVVGVNIAYS